MCNTWSINRFVSCFFVGRYYSSISLQFSRKNPPANIPPIFIGDSTSEWVSKSRLLGMTVDEKLTWTPHMLDLKKSFAKKLGLLKKSRFLPRTVRQDLYFNVILPSVTYGLILWGSCCNSDFTAGLLDLFLTYRKTWLLLMSYNELNGRLCLFIIN